MKTNFDRNIGSPLPKPVVRQKTGVVRIVAQDGASNKWLLKLDVDGVYVGWYNQRSDKLNLWSNTTKVEAEAVAAFLKRHQYADVTEQVAEHIARWCY